MTKSKNFLRCIVVGIAFAALTVFSGYGAMPSATDAFYVNDFANVLNEETEKYILNNSRALDEKTTAQVVVATVESLENSDVNDYALSLFRQWGIGTKEKNNGLLILLAPNERKVCVRTGYGLEGKINDSKAGRFLDEYAAPYFKSDNWDDGIKNVYAALVSEVYSEYNIDMPSEVSDVVLNHDEISESSHMSTVMGLVIVGLMVVFGGIIPFIIRKRRGEDPFSNDGFGGFGGFGGDNFGGGGFGGFGGGGGSSGGGGASRGF